MISYCLSSKNCKTRTSKSEYFSVQPHQLRRGTFGTVVLIAVESILTFKNKIWCRSPPPPPAKTKPRIVSMVPVKNCCEATEAWLIALSRTCRPTRCTSWYMYAVYAPVRYLRKQTSWLSLWRQNGGSFFSLLSTLLDLVIRCKDRDLRCTRHRRCRLAGGTDRNSL